MTEDRIKELIHGYVCAEMKLVPDSDILPNHPAYSRKFNRKMKQMMRAGDYFGGNLRLYTVLSRAAAVVLIVLSLAVANQASAAIFGFNPWKEVVEYFFPDVEMEQKSYKKNEIKRDDTKKPISDVPTYVPEGYIEVDNQKNDWIAAVEWQKIGDDEATTGIAYSREIVDKDANYYEDTAYEKTVTTEIAGYEAKIYYKSNVVLIRWLDEKYLYLIYTDDLKNAKETIIRMAESIYQKK